LHVCDLPTSRRALSGREILRAVANNCGFGCMVMAGCSWCSWCNGLIDPTSRWVIIWYRLLLICLLYSAITIPFQVAFEVAAGTIDAICDALFWIDIAINFRLGFLDDKNTHPGEPRRLVMDSWRIVRRYLAFWFWIDLASVFPFTLVLALALPKNDRNEGSSTRLARLVRLTRLPRLLRIFKFVRMPPAFSFDPNVYRLVRLLFSLFIVVHLVACGLHLTALLEEILLLDDDLATNSSSTPLTAGESPECVTWTACALESGQMTDSPGDRYAMSLYWAIMTMSTVGYGDVYLQTTAERLFACFAMMLGAVTFAYMLGNVQHLMSHLDSNAAQLRTRMDAITAFMRHRDISPELALRVRNFFCFLWSRQAVFDEATILSELPAHLRREVALEMHAAIISRVSFFAGTPDAFIAECVTRMRPVQAAEGDVLIRGARPVPSPVHCAALAVGVVTNVYVWTGLRTALACGSGVCAGLACGSDLRSASDLRGSGCVRRTANLCAFV
jgi:hypothetical protein